MYAKRENKLRSIELLKNQKFKWDKLIKNCQKIERIIKKD